MHRVQAQNSRAVVVYSWGGHSSLMRIFRWPVRLAQQMIARRSRIAEPAQDREVESLLQSPGTFVHHHDPSWVRGQLDRIQDYEIVVWRSVSTAFLRAFIHQQTFGKGSLRILYRVEEFAPHLMGRWGQYPMIVMSKPSPKGSMN